MEVVRLVVAEVIDVEFGEVVIVVVLVVWV